MLSILHVDMTAIPGIIEIEFDSYIVKEVSTALNLLTD